MAYEIHITRFAEDLETVIPITREQWNDCVQHIKDLRYVEADFPDSIEVYSEERKEWLPIFWINSGRGSMRSSGFFNHADVYQKGMEIAQHLEAFVFGDENEVYFLPGYGEVSDEVHPYNTVLKMDDLIEYKDEYGQQYDRIIEIVIKKNQASKKIKSVPKRKITKMDPWTIVKIIIILLMIGYLFWSKFSSKL